MADEPKTPGEILKGFRRRAKLSPEELAERLGVDVQTIKKWESDGTPAHQAPHRILSILTGRSGDFTFLRDLMAQPLPLEESKAIEEPKEPDIPREKPPPDLRAFDRHWLDRQPEHKRGGLLLRACRERLGLSQPTLARMLGGNKQHISLWEVADQALSDAQRDKLMTIFRYISNQLPKQERWFDSAMEKRFIEIWDGSNPLVREKSNTMHLKRHRNLRRSAPQIVEEGNSESRKPGRPRKSGAETLFPIWDDDDTPSRG